MSALRVLYIGGSGIISSACVRRSLHLGHEVTVLNRGESPLRPVPGEVEQLTGDIRDPDGVRRLLGDREFDSVSEFVAFTPDHVETDIDLFDGRCGQYVFISSASAYQKPPARLPITEATPLRNPYWQYSRDKIACEDRLAAAYRETGFPVLVVRPSHTYDDTSMPTLGGWNDIARMRDGRPVLVHGDGSSLWTITHAEDFAVAYAAALGRRDLIGAALTITGDEAPTWDEIYRSMGRAAGAPEPDLVHVASETIARELPDAGPGLLGDRAHTVLFDTALAKSIAPGFGTTIRFDEGARRMIAWREAHPETQRVDAASDAAFDRLIVAARP